MTALPDKRYKIIYADPPWNYENWGEGAQRNVQEKYPTMTVEDICAIPVKNIADDNCILFMWATYPRLKEAFQVITAWGFEYKTVAFVWVKQNEQTPSLFWGMGYWTRANSEICMLATKGQPKRISTDVHQVVMKSVREHSRKPDEVRTRIVKLVGDLPRIELFARQRLQGWDAWGFDAPKETQLLLPITDISQERDAQ